MFPSRARVYLLVAFFSHGRNVGTQPFGPLTLLTRPPTLIPRPETEEWTIRLASFITTFLSKHQEPVSSSNPLHILDLCTGSGCIPLLLCQLLPKGSVRSVGVDISKSALQLARDNAVICGNWIDGGDGYEERGTGEKPWPDGLNRETCGREMNTFTTVLADIQKRTTLSTILRSLINLPSPIPVSKSISSKPFKPFTILTANPPYITPSAYEKLDPSVRDYEDRGALIGTDDPRLLTAGTGLGFYYDIATFVREGGMLAGNEDIILDGAATKEDRDSTRGRCAVVAMEVGEGQAGDVVDIVKEGMPGFGESVEVWTDAFGVDRVVVATRSR